MSSKPIRFERKPNNSELEKQRAFRQRITKMLEENEERLQEALNSLPPHRFVEAYLKLLPFGLSRAPEEKALTPEEMKVIELRKEKNVIALLSEGDVEDIEEEEEED